MTNSVCFQCSLVVQQIFATTWLAIIVQPDQESLSAEQTVSKEFVKDDISTGAVCLQCGGFYCCWCAVALWNSRLAQVLLIRIKPSSLLLSLSQVSKITQFAQLTIVHLAESGHKSHIRYSYQSILVLHNRYILDRHTRLPSSPPISIRISQAAFIRQSQALSGSRRQASLPACWQHPAAATCHSPNNGHL